MSVLRSLIGTDFAPPPPPPPPPQLPPVDDSPWLYPLIGVLTDVAKTLFHRALARRQPYIHPGPCAEQRAERHQGDEPEAEAG